MQVTQTSREEINPFLQLLILGISALIGLVIFILIGLVICVVIYGTDLIKDLSWLTAGNLKYIGALKIILFAQQIGFFLVPAVTLSLFERKSPQKFYGIKRPFISLLIVVFLIMACTTPFLGWINEQNMKMHLPDFLNDVEKWMRISEDQGKITTSAILKGTSFGSLAINLILVGLTPAICEELIFRGGLQRTFIRMMKNHHIAIWTSAIIFSAIHVQFFGFFPRLLLGAGFGYIYFWTGNIWYTAFAHFLNNGYAVMLVWYLQRNKMPLDKVDETSVAWYVALISAILTIALFWILKEKSTGKNSPQHTILNED
jgi:membrane protease YdiL (CAAX protease family)